MSRPEILSRFPPKPTADILVSRFFNTYDPGIHIIHGPTFQKEYDRHWLNPDETPIIWLGLVFAMMCIALQSYTRAGDEPPEYNGKSWAMSKEYRDLTAQCLVMADITQPTQGMLETLIRVLAQQRCRSRHIHQHRHHRSTSHATGYASRPSPVPWYLRIPGRDATKSLVLHSVLRPPLLCPGWATAYHATARYQHGCPTQSLR
jgi:hypothetical protein